MQNQCGANISGRKLRKQSPLRGLFFALGCLLLVSCSSGSNVLPKKEVRRDWFYPTRKHAPEEVYNRLREVRPPEPIPDPPRNVDEAPRLLPVIQVNIKNTKLSEVARILAQSYRYSFYCSPLVAEQRISLRAIGTLDELADQVAQTASIRISVDHENREVRILTGARVREAEPTATTPTPRPEAAKPTVRKVNRTLGRRNRRPTGR